MKTLRILFLLSIIGILSLIFISSSEKNLEEATISSIKYSENSIIINLENKNAVLMILENKMTNLKQGDKILFLGKENTYKNQTQIIADKIIKIK